MHFPEFIALLTDTLFYFVATGALAGVLLYRGRTLSAFVLTVCSLLSALTVDVLKHLTNVERPLDSLVEVAGSAFPSGHAAGGAFLAIAVIAVFLPTAKTKRARYALTSFSLLIGLLIGLSRLYLGVHRPLEVSVGLLIGWLWGALFLYFLLWKKP